VSEPVWCTYLLGDRCRKAIMAFTLDADCVTVVVTLEKAETLSADVRGMLSHGLPLATREVPASRHRYQEDVIGMARDALVSEQGAVVEKAGAIAGKVAAAEAEFDALRARLEEADKALDRATAEAQKKQAASKAAAAEASTGEAHYAAANAETKKVEAQVMAARQKRDSAEAIADCPLKMLVSGSCEDDESTQEAIQAVVAFLTEIDAEAVLVAAAPAALKSKPAVRQGFDEVVVNGISEAVATRRGLLEASAAAAEKVLAEAESEALGLWAISDVAQAAADAANAEWQTAEEARMVASEARKEVNKEMTKGTHAVNSTLSEQAKHEPRLQTLSAALEAMDRLKAGDYSSDMAVDTPPADGEAAADVDMGDAAPVAVDLAAGAPAVAMVA